MSDMDKKTNGHVRPIDVPSRESKSPYDAEYNEQKKRESEKRIQGTASKKRDRMSGNEAVALAIKQVNPDVMPAFPITPSTAICAA